VKSGRFGAHKTARLLIRDLEIGDADALFAYKSKPEVIRYQFWRPQSLDEVREFILDMEAVEADTPGTWLQLAICLREGGALIGDIGMHFIADSPGQVEIGYTVSPDRQRQGYATEVVRAMLAYLFETLGKHRVTASVDPRNASSAAVLEKAGFSKEAHFRKSVFMDGEWCDDVVYAILEEEWK
jgi:RimJ/RimL family protein N-acetyltransferase